MGSDKLRRPKSIQRSQTMQWQGFGHEGRTMGILAMSDALLFANPFNS